MNYHNISFITTYDLILLVQSWEIISLNLDELRKPYYILEIVGASHRMTFLIQFCDYLCSFRAIAIKIF